MTCPVCREPIIRGQSIHNGAPITLDAAVAGDSGRAMIDPQHNPPLVAFLKDGAAVREAADSGVALYRVHSCRETRRRRSKARRRAARH